MNTATITSSSFLQRWTQDAHIFESAHYSHSFTSHTHLGMCVEHYGVLALSGFARCSHLLSISRVDSIEEVKEKIQSRPLLDTLQALPAIVVDEMLTDLGVNSMPSEEYNLLNDEEQLAILHESFMAMGLWSILSCLDRGVLDIMVEFLHQSKSDTGQRAESIKRIVQACYPNCKLAWHAGIRCHSCGAVIFGARFNCDQMAFQDYCMQCREAFKPDKPFTFSVLYDISTQEEELQQIFDKYFLQDGYPAPTWPFTPKVKLANPQASVTPYHPTRASTKVKETVQGMLGTLKILQLACEPSWSSDTEVKTEICIAIVSQLRSQNQNILNVLLDTPLLPMNSKGSCSIEVVYKDMEYYEVEISFVKMEQWTERERVLVAEWHQAIPMETLAVLQSIYGPVNAVRWKSKQSYLSIANTYPEYIKAHFGKTKIYQLGSLSSIQSLLVQFIAPKTFTSLSLWPLVSNISIRGPIRSLPKMIRLVHVSDTSSLTHLRGCDMIYVSNISDKNLIASLREIFTGFQEDSVKRSIVYVPVKGTATVPPTILKELIKTVWRRSLNNLRQHAFGEALSLLQKPLLSTRKTLNSLEINLQFSATLDKLDGKLKKHRDDSVNSLKQRLHSVITLASDRLITAARQSLEDTNIDSIKEKWATNSKYFTQACRNGGKYMTLDMNRDVGSIIVARSGSVWDDFQRCVQGCVLGAHYELQDLIALLKNKEALTLKPSCIQKAEAESIQWVVLEKKECAATIMADISSSLSSFYTNCRAQSPPLPAHELTDKVDPAMRKIDFEEIARNSIKYLQASVATVARLLLELFDEYAAALVDDIRTVEGLRDSITLLSKEVDNAMPRLEHPTDDKYISKPPAPESHAAKLPSHDTDPTPNPDASKSPPTEASSSKPSPCKTTVPKPTRNELDASKSHSHESQISEPTLHKPNKPSTPPNRQKRKSTELSSTSQHTADYGARETLSNNKSHTTDEPPSDSSKSPPRPLRPIQTAAQRSAELAAQRERQRANLHSKRMYDEITQPVPEQSRVPSRAVGPQSDQNHEVHRFDKLGSSPTNPLEISTDELMDIGSPLQPQSHSLMSVAGSTLQSTTEDVNPTTAPTPSEVLLVQRTSEISLAALPNEALHVTSPTETSTAASQLNSSIITGNFLEPAPASTLATPINTPVPAPIIPSVLKYSSLLPTPTNVYYPPVPSMVQQPRYQNPMTKPFRAPRSQMVQPPMPPAQQLNRQHQVHALQLEQQHQSRVLHRQVEIMKSKQLRPSPQYQPLQLLSQQPQPLQAQHTQQPFLQPLHGQQAFLQPPHAQQHYQYSQPPPQLPQANAPVWYTYNPPPPGMFNQLPHSNF